jgi:hypothetical protein
LVLHSGLSTNLSGPLSDTWAWDGSNWTQLSGLGVSPDPRQRHAMSPNVTAGQVLLFGGTPDLNGGGLSDTWIWDGVKWTQKSPQTSPPARINHALAYDASRGQVVLFGGRGSGGDACFAQCNDTWIWDGNNWIKKSPAVTPPSSQYGTYALAYDAARQQVVLFGAGTWVWDGTNWNQKMPANSPAYREDHAMAYDAARQQVVIFGGGNSTQGELLDTWVWDGSNWTQKSPQTSPPQGYGRTFMAYDAGHQHIVLFDSLGGTWFWDGNNWIQQSPTISPGARLFHAMAYDATHGQVVLFGGLQNINSSDTWIFPGSKMAANTGTTPQSAAIGHAFATPLAVTVTDGDNIAQPGVVVTFSAAPNGASGVFANNTISTQATTGNDGVATATMFTANSIQGTYNVTALAGGNAVSFALTNSAGPPALMTARAGTTPQSAPAAQPFGVALAVTVTDGSNNPAPGVTVTFTAPSSGASGKFANNTNTTQATTGADGVATASIFTANATVGGPYNVTASSSGLTSVNFALTNTTAAATMAANAGTTPQSARANQVFATALAVTVKDGGNLPAPGVTVTFTAPSSGPSGLFANGMPTTQAITNSSGIATATTLTANANAGGPYIVTASAVGLTSVNFTLTNTAALNWSQKSPQNSPSARFNHAMAYDALHQQVVLFGGADTSSNVFSDTWVWDGANWSHKSPQTSPPARYGHAMAYDAARQQVLLFGGQDVNGQFLADTWVWDGSTWAQKPLVNAAMVKFSAMAYDAAHQQVVVFGQPNPSDDTYLWNGSGWTSASGNPHPRDSGPLAYDAARGQVVLFNGATWVWNGTNWLQKSPQTSPPSLGPTADAYDAADGLVILFGGYSSSDTWAWDGTTWTRESIQTIPPARFDHAMAYDSARGQVVMFGGGSGLSAGSVTGGLSDTWVLPGNSGSGSGSTMTANASTTPQSAATGQAFGTPLGVTVLDGSNSPMAGVMVTFSAPSSGASGTFANNTTTTQVTTGNNGVATATTFTANATVGGPYSVTASATGLNIVNFALTNTGMTSCTFTLMTSATSIPVAGGTGSFSFTASGQSCAWTATPSPSFISITSATSGTGSGMVSFNVTANAGAARSGTITVGGQTFNINQAGTSACTFMLTPTSASSPIGGGAGSFGITATGQNCAWSAASNNSFISVTSGANGTGNGTVNYTVTANSGAPRSGTITAAGLTFTVNQAGVPGICARFPSQGGSPGPATLLVSPSTLNFGISGASVTGPQTVTLIFSNAGASTWTAASNRSNIVVSPTTGSGSGAFQVTVSVTPGPSGTITVTSAGATNSPRQVQVNVANVGNPTPFGSLDTPANNATNISGAIPVGGWALDNVEVLKVDIWREKIGNEDVRPNGLVYIGDAMFVPGARPDVQAAYPNHPFNTRAGWGYALLTTVLPNNGGSPGPGNGTYVLHAIAHDRAGLATDLGARTITVDNAHATKPFGTIDTPSQNDSVNGSAYQNFGWALTPKPNMIPTDGSTINVLVDGVALGHPTYNQFRPDVANLFPGLANSNGAAGNFCIDTTSLPNGLHTISWTVFDSANNGDGIGSRYFTVLNNSASVVAAPEEPTGSRANRVAELPVVEPDSGEVHTIQPDELGRVVFQTGATSGYLLVGGERMPLPAGSAVLDGVFYWQPGAGFLGDYNLMFERPDGTTVRARAVVRPKN